MSEDRAAQPGSGLRDARLEFVAEQVASLDREHRDLAAGTAGAAAAFTARLQQLIRLTGWLDVPPGAGAGTGDADALDRIRSDLAALAVREKFDPTPFLDSSGGSVTAIRRAEQLYEVLVKSRKSERDVVRSSLEALCGAARETAVWPHDSRLPVGELAARATGFEIDGNAIDFELTASEPFRARARLVWHDATGPSSALMVARRAIHESDAGDAGVADLRWGCGGVAAAVWKALSEQRDRLAGQDDEESSKQVTAGLREWVDLALRGGSPDQFASLAFDVIERLADADSSEPRSSESDLVKRRRTVARELARSLPQQIRILDRTALLDMEPEQLQANTRVDHREIDDKRPKGRLSRFLSMGYQLLDADRAVVRMIPAIATVSAGSGPQLRGKIQDVLLRLRCVDEERFAERCSAWIHRIEQRFVATMMSALEAGSDEETSYQRALEAGNDEALVLLIEVLTDVEAVLHDGAVSAAAREELVRLQAELWTIGDGVGANRLEFVRPARESFLRQDELHSEDVEFETVYDDDVEFGRLLRVARSGVRRGERVHPKCLAFVSLGRKPELVRGIEAFRESFGVQPFDSELQDALRLQKLIPFANDARASDELSRELVTRVESCLRSMQELDALAATFTDDAQDRDNVLWPFIEYLGFNDRLVFPAGAKWHERHPDAPRWSGAESDREQMAAAFEVTEAWSSDKRRGQIIRVERFGIYDEVAGAVLLPARVVVSRGERFALGETVDELRGRLSSGLDDATPQIARLDAIRAAGEDRSVARRELQQTEESDAEYAGRRARLEAVEERLSTLMCSAIEEFDRTAQSMPAEQGRLLTECADVLIHETQDALGLRSFPRPGEVLTESSFARRDYEAVESTWSRQEPLGFVAAVTIRGLRRRDALLQKASVQVSRGPKPAFVEYLDRLAASLARHGGNAELNEDVARVRERIEEVWRQSPFASAADQDALARDTVALGMQLEATGRQTSDDALLAELRQAFDSVAAEFAGRYPGLRRFGRDQRELGEADLRAGYDVTWRRADSVRGTVLEVVQEGVLWDGLAEQSGGPLVPAKVVLSSGPGADDLLELERWLQFVEQHAGAPALRSDLEQMVQAVQSGGPDAKVVDHVPLATLASRVGSLDLLATSAGEAPASLGVLGRLLTEGGFRRFPEDGPVDAAQLSSDAFDESKGEFAEGRAPHELVRVERYGWHAPEGGVAVPARVIWSRGPAGFLGEVLHGDAFEKAMQACPSLIGYVEQNGLGASDAGVVRDEDAALLHCAELFERLAKVQDPSVGALREILDAVFSKHRVTFFPRAGEPLRLPPGAAAGAARTQFVFDSAPEGTVVEVLSPGVAAAADNSARVLRAADCIVSCGPMSALDQLMETGSEHFREELVQTEPRQTALKAMTEYQRDRKKTADLRQQLESVWLAVSAVLDELRGQGTTELAQWLRQVETATRDQLVPIGYRFVPERVGDSLDSFPTELVQQPPIRRCQSGVPTGQIVEIRRRGMLAPGAEPQVRQTAILVVNAGEPTPQYLMLEELQQKLMSAAGPDAQVVADALEAGKQRALDAGASPYQEAMDAMRVLYQHKSQIPSAATFRMLRQDVQKYLDEFSIREFIRLGDPRNLIDKETARIRVKNAEALSSIRDCVVARIDVPGFERDGQTIQDAEIVVGAKQGG